MYNYISARYSNPEQTVIEVQTEENGAMLIDEHRKVKGINLWKHFHKKFDVKKVEPYDDGLTYRDKRAKEYPPVTDQLDAIMKWLATEGEFSIPDELKSIAMKCMSVKAKYPKE